MANNNRPARLAQRIKVILAEALQKTVKDDRVENVTITDAKVTNDLQQATVYYTVYGDEDTVAAGHAAMTEHRGMLRREMGRGLNIRLVRPWNWCRIRCRRPQHTWKISCVLRALVMKNWPLTETSRSTLARRIRTARRTTTGQETDGW